MKLYLALCAVAAGALSAAALAQSAPENGATEAMPADKAALIESCSAHKFETIVQFTGANGKPRQSKVRLCGAPGQTDAQWAVTLRDAAKKVEANAAMTPEARQQVVAALEAELAKFAAAEAAAPAQAATSTFALPPADSGGTPARAALLEYSTLPPLTAPAPVASAGAPALAAVAVAPAAPRLTIRCVLPSDYGAASACASIESETRLAVRADEALPAGLKLRFLRRGDARGEVALAAMRQGQTLQVRPPAKLCAGVVRSSTQIQIVRTGIGVAAGGQVLDTLGPYELKC
jgi:hypothetical protein